MAFFFPLACRLGLRSTPQHASDDESSGGEGGVGGSGTTAATCWRPKLLLQLAEVRAFAEAKPDGWWDRSVEPRLAEPRPKRSHTSAR